MLARWVLSTLEERGEEVCCAKSLSCKDETGAQGGRRVS
jgi:hypothetical protein